MSSKPLIIKDCRYQNFYQQALKLAQEYCPDWMNAFKSEDLTDFNPEDPGIVLLKLFARLNEMLSREINRIPDKHQLAFYDFVGMDYIPAAAARVPLTFLLSAGSREAAVPERAQIASSLQPTIIYQTTEALTAINLNIAAAYSVNPWQDRYTDHSVVINGSGNDFYIFGGDPSQQPIPRLLYLADESFNFKTPTQITVHMTLMTSNQNTNSYLEDLKDNLLHVFTACTDGEDNPVAFEFDDPDKTIVIEDLLLPQSEINAESGYWLALRPDPKLTVADLATLGITSITCDIMANNILPDLCSANDIVVDLKKGFDPFGETPEIGDAFYIGSSEVFAEAGATVILTFDLTAGAGDASLQWQYWNGLAWIDFSFSKDETNNFRTSKTADSKNPELTFTGFPKIPEDELNGAKSRWIRAVIVSGGYGHAGEYQAPASLDGILENVLNQYITDQDDLDKAINELEEAGIFSGYVYSEATYQAPHINNITLSYTVAGKSVAEVITQNGFAFQTIATPVPLENSFAPFPALNETNPSFYIGFNESFGNYPLNLYFSCKAKLSSDTCQIGDPNVPSDEQTETSGFQWFYLQAGNNWTDLTVDDETENFSGSGLVKTIIPVNIATSKLFGQELYWLKVSAKDGSKFTPSKLRGVFPNTVWAEQAVSITDELLGMGIGEAGQELSFANGSLLAGQGIEIREPGIPSTAEMAIIHSEEGSDAIRLVLNNAGDLNEVWVRWHEVKNFTQSTPLSRHYLLDRKAGTVKFGDGLRGMLPPIVSNNIVAREYQSGGGLQGNQAEKTVTELKTALVNIQSVTNYDAAVGGKDCEDNPAFLERAPSSLKNYDRAVTPDDLESLALESSSGVVRARYVMPEGGEIEQADNHLIHMVIATDTGTDPPSTDTGLVALVRNYLRERAFVGIKDWIQVQGATYRQIKVTATVIPKSVSDGVAAEEGVKTALKAYFDPFRGGSDGTGWQFGQTIYFSKVAALIEETAGIKSMTKLVITKISGENEDEQILDDPTQAGKTVLSLEKTELPYPGDMLVELKLDSEV